MNASMILSGMGPVDPLRSSGAKLFASFYALFSGLLFIAVASMLTGPFIHRILHRLDVKKDNRIAKRALSDSDGVLRAKG